MITKAAWFGYLDEVNNVLPNAPILTFPLARRKGQVLGP